MIRAHTFWNSIWHARFIQFHPQSSKLGIHWQRAAGTRSVNWGWHESPSFGEKHWVADAGQLQLWSQESGSIHVATQSLIQICNFLIRSCAVSFKCRRDADHLVFPWLACMNFHYLPLAWIYAPSNRTSIERYREARSTCKLCSKNFGKQVLTNGLDAVAIANKLIQKGCNTFPLMDAFFNVFERFSF